MPVAPALAIVLMAVGAATQTTVTKSGASAATGKFLLCCNEVYPTKISAENGPIRLGDLLVTSSEPGFAIKGADRNRMLGAVIGKELGSLDSGNGLIEVLVALQ